MKLVLRYQNGFAIEKKEDRLNWSRDDHFNYATFNWYSRELTISRILFIEENAKRASILAHEYRHSLQGTNIMWQSVLAVFLTGRKPEHLGERDARSFEWDYYTFIAEIDE